MATLVSMSQATVSSFRNCVHCLYIAVVTVCMQRIGGNTE